MATTALDAGSPAKDYGKVEYRCSDRRFHVCVLLPVCGVKGLGLVIVVLLFYCVVLCVTTVTHYVMCLLGVSCYCCLVGLQ